MNLKQLMCTSLLLAGVLILGPATISRAQDTTLAQTAAASPIPDVTIPGVPPTGNCCLWQIHKRANGKRTAVFGTPYQCATGQTARGDTRIKLTLNTEGPPCDQGTAIIPNGSILEASGNTIKRASGFAHFFGKFTIKNPAGAVLFEGTMEAIDRIGTHHPPFGTEACNRQNHLEGWLIGRGSNLFPNSTLRALIVARAALPTPNIPTQAVSGSIDGVFIKCP